ncbi:MAG: hypothetical protein WBH03_07530 [Cyclobacteriaceae bacterium]
MAVTMHILHYKNAAMLTTKWILADNLTKVLLKKIDQQKLQGFTVNGHHYFSTREILSLVEKYLTEK